MLGGCIKNNAVFIWQWNYCLNRGNTMAEEEIHQQFTEEQLSDLQFDDMASLIPGGGALAIGAKKGASLAEPYVKKAVEEVIEHAPAVINKASELAQEARHVVGEYIAKDVDGLKVLDHVAQNASSGLSVMTQKAKNMLSDVPVLGDVVNPNLETRIAIQQHALSKELFSSDNLARAQKYGNLSDVDVAMNAIKDSAEKLTKDIVENPQLAQQLNKNLTNEQIKSGIVNNVDTKKLTHGSSVMGNYTPDVPPPSVKDFFPLSARDALHLATLPQAPSPIRAARYEQLVDAQYLVHAEKMKMASVPYASLTYGGGSWAAMKYALSGSDVSANDGLSKVFLKATQAGTDASIKEMVKSHEELEGAALYYQSAKNGLKSDDGQLSDNNKAALVKVADNVVDKIKSDGPQYFDKLPQSLMREEIAPVVTMQHNLEK